MTTPISRSSPIPPPSNEAHLNQLKTKLSSHMDEFSQLINSLLQSHSLSDNPEFHSQLAQAIQNLASSSKEAQKMRS